MDTIFELIIYANTLHQLQESQQLRLVHSYLYRYYSIRLCIKRAQGQLCLQLRVVECGGRHRIVQIIVEHQIQFDIQVLDEIVIGPLFIELALNNFLKVA